MNQEQNRRLNDYPELQVGFPERNDASFPANDEMERIHVDLENLHISRKKAADLMQELRRPSGTGATNG